MGQRAQIT
jgi:hypothetical protein